MQRTIFYQLTRRIFKKFKSYTILKAYDSNI